MQVLSDASYSSSFQVFSQSNPGNDYWLNTKTLQKKIEPLIKRFSKKIFEHSTNLYFIHSVLSNYLLLHSYIQCRVPFYKISHNPLSILANIFLLNGLTTKLSTTSSRADGFIGTIFLFYLLFPLIYKLYRYIKTYNPRLLFLLPLGGVIVSAIFQTGIFLHYRRLTLSKPGSFTLLQHHKSTSLYADRCNAKLLSEKYKTV